MKLLLYNNFCHKKNLEGIQLMCKSKNIEFIESKVNKVYTDVDIVFIPTGWIEPTKFPNAKLIIYGPHNFVFPDDEWKSKKFTNSNIIYYNCLSNWIIDIFNETAIFSKSFNLITLPFAVNINRFKPNKNNYLYDCFIYFKHRNVKDLDLVVKLVSKLNLKYTVIKYGSYDENNYIDILNSSKFGIWIDAHESQGFALQEALSTNTPLLVWNATDMFYEYVNNSQPYANKKNKYKLLCSSAPYFDNNCGVLLNNPSEDDLFNNIKDMNDIFLHYNPRKYILDNLSPEVCMQRWLDLL